MSKYLNNYFSYFILFLPSSFLLTVFVIYPLCNGVRLSFTNSSPLSPTNEWIGFENFYYLLTDTDFYEILYNSFFLVFASIISAVIIGFFIALSMFKNLPGGLLIQGGIFQIWIVPWITISILWGWLYNFEYGIVNYILISLGVVDNNLNWFANPFLAQITIISAYTWRLIPFMMVISLAALQSIPKDILEVSEIDGANSYKRLLHIIFPLIKNIIFVVCILQSVRLFQEITLPWILTQGGPINATTTLSIYTYKTAFQSWDFGMASAIGTVWLIIVIMFSLIYLKKFSKSF